MKLTKYEHACMTLEKHNKTLVIDPGNLSNDFIAPDTVVAVVITHEHSDHYDPERLAEIIDKNPAAIIIAPPSVTQQLETFEHHAAKPGEAFTIGPFELRFFGGEHAVIHDSIPAIQNLAVMVNGLFYYAGDSLVIPPDSVDTLALPAIAPWCKISEIIDYLQAVRPRLAFPVHDAIASDPGKAIIDTVIDEAATNTGIRYLRLADSIEL